MTIKNIIFDLGNVIIDLDLPRSEQELIKLIGKKQLETIVAETNILERFEIGIVSEEIFLTTLKGTQNLENQAIIDAWNAMLLGLPAHRLDMLEALKNKYNVYLLSNTNKIHLDWVYQYLEKRYNIKDFEERFFHKAYYSHLINLRKPNTNIYEYVLADAKMNAQETLFIDDNADNIEGAKYLGIQTILHPIGDEIVTVLSKLLQ